MAKKGNTQTKQTSSPTIDIDELINGYRSIYESKVRDFNVLTTVHLSENDHTNILCEILNMKDGDQKPFMKSFVKDVLCIDLLYYDHFVAKTQIKSIGNNKKGYIDLLLESPSIYIVIENKICGAGDMDNQLIRYYYTYVKPGDNEEIPNINNQVQRYWKEKKQIIQNDVFIVYLTETMDKQPNTKSLPNDFKNQIDKHYIQISYEEHIYDWLKNKVLPKIPYGKTGDAHNSIILYLRELENILGINTAQNESYLEDKRIRTLLSVDDRENKCKEQFTFLDYLYNELLKKQKTDDENHEDYILSDLLNCVSCYRTNVYGQFAPNGWTVYAADQYLTIFQTKWIEKFGGKKTSGVHFTMTKWRTKNAELELGIHGAAKKAYIDETSKKLIKEKLGEDIWKEIKKDNKYFDVNLSIKKIGTWDPKNPKAFFDAFVENENIKSFVKLAENDFK